ncbi:hypothetical protein [Paeniglutamicibacter cryotolerans]|uniref:Uncharacterized protein n=1 Tax=Paeniglutamicibacter cryotolerans TaxID=670079 RepID=A0A839QFS9_9MICC|nr:hypothetical protein [Paeniglutamicibacter cryotolerans]MBB2994750.1 hypothetical protein [Paeniglutamicibacter cryotolerans]
MSDLIDLPQDGTSTAENWRERVLDGMGRRLEQMVASHEVTDFSGEAERATVNAMADAVGTANRINDRLGAFYTTDRVRKVLGDVSRQAVSERAKNHRLLRVKTADGVVLFPAFQFINGAVATGLRKLLSILLGTGVDGWAVTYWLTARLAQLGESTALDVLASGDSGRIAKLGKLAATDAAGWHAAA